MVLFTELCASQLKDVPVIDCLQDRIGVVKDLLVTLAEPYPALAGILVTAPKRRDFIILINDLEMIGQHFIATNTTKENIAYVREISDAWPVLSGLLDKQVVDMVSARVLRVNDLKLAKIGQGVNVVGVDVGVRGILRQLGMEKFIERLFSRFKLGFPQKIIDWSQIEQFGGQLKAGSRHAFHQRLNALHPADVAHIISHVPATEKSIIFELLADDTAAGVLHELEPRIQAMLVNAVDSKKAIRVVEKMPADDIAEVLRQLDKDKVDGLLRLLGTRKMEKVKNILGHREETAGGLMTSEFIGIPDDFTAEDAIAKLRQVAPDAETIYYLYVIDKNEVLRGVLSLRDLLVAHPQTPIANLMQTEVKQVLPKDGAKKVADCISKYNLFALPVVDAAGKILGIVTVDDVIDFILPPVAKRKKQILG